MFQAIAPNRAAERIVSVTWWESTIPFAIVVATLSETSAPSTFSTAESSTAARGRRAPVATAVATAFAESWKPLVKSNASAVATTQTQPPEGVVRRASASRVSGGLAPGESRATSRAATSRVD
jgi:hypothetical protein